MIVGGDLAAPSVVERSVLAAIDRLVPVGDRTARGLVLLGGRPRADVARLLVAAARGRAGGWPAGGVYVDGAWKEEFGLAVIEALAAGLVVVAPSTGGPPTYVDDGDIGVLVDPDADLGRAIGRAFALVDRPGPRRTSARRMIEQRILGDDDGRRTRRPLPGAGDTAVNLLVISPEYASHYGPLAVLAGEAAARRGAGRRRHGAEPARPCRGRRLRVAAAAPRGRLEPGLVTDSPAIRRVHRRDPCRPLATIRHPGARPVSATCCGTLSGVAGDIGGLCAELDPDDVLVDHVSFGSTLAMYATGRPFVTLVPGHPSQLPVGAERYGIPPRWPTVHDTGSVRAGRARAARRPRHRRVHRPLERRACGRRAWAPPARRRVPGPRPARAVQQRRAASTRTRAVTCSRQRHRFVGPLVRAEALPDALRSWAEPSNDRPQVFVALGTFLSHALRTCSCAHRGRAARTCDVRAAIATGATPPRLLGPVPDDWIVAPALPQVAMLRSADLAIHHGGNNSVQESLAAGVRQLVLPMSTDQFANAADLERTGVAVAASPNDTTAVGLAAAISTSLAGGRSSPVVAPTRRWLLAAPCA